MILFDMFSYLRLFEIVGADQTSQQLLITTGDNLVSSDMDMMVMNENFIKNDMLRPMYMYLLIGVCILILFIIIIEFYVKYKSPERKFVERQDIEDNNQETSSH